MTLVHFIFVIKNSDLGKRDKEFEYVKKMAEFFKVWVQKVFSKKIDVKCDIMITKPTNIFQKLDTGNLLKDHRQRGEEIYHFYLCYFRPLWTDCTCEGYHAENFGMVLWQKPKNEDDVLFLAHKNCTIVSHELAHELLRQIGNKNYIELVHESWTSHHINDLPYEHFDSEFKKTKETPYFLTIDSSNFR